MRLVRTVEELASALAGVRPAFVPTMGALHAGHLALVRRAVEVAPVGASVLVSIFVNPTQFGPNEDYTRYPRMLDADMNAAESAGAEIIFAPDVQTIYPKGDASDSFFSNLPEVATRPHLEDAFRPTHFAGVCQVVARLFDLVQPSVAVFGEKDYQQLRVISDLVALERGRWGNLKIIPHSTVREPDGLAMSSRNAYLKPEERVRALALFSALKAAQDLAKAKSMTSRIELAMREILLQHHLAADYAAVRDARTLMPATTFERPLRALIAAKLGNVRLIDNMSLGESPANS